MKNIYYGILIAVILFVSGVLVGKFGFSTHKIEVKEKVVYQTVWKEKVSTEFTQDNFDKLMLCYNSSINFSNRLEKNYLFVTAFDDCKEATVKYEITANSDWRIYAGIGVVGVLAGGYFAYKLLK